MAHSLEESRFAVAMFRCLKRSIVSLLLRTSVFHIQPKSCRFHVRFA
jgi:hypothetical protein